jgi:hypothetical protein
MAPTHDDRDGPPIAGRFATEADARQAADDVNESHGGAPFVDPDLDELITAEPAQHVDGWWGVWPVVHAEPI